MRRITAIIMVVLMCLVSIDIGAKTNRGHVLATDTDHDGVVNQNTIREGHDYILVKQNPTTLNDGALTFMTNKDGIVTAAVYSDLDNPAAFKKIFIAQVTSTGVLKIFTLANLGYLKIFTQQKPQQGKKYYLLTDKGTMDIVQNVEYDNSVPNLRSLDDYNEAKAKIASAKQPTLEKPRYFKRHDGSDLKEMLQKIKAVVSSLPAATTSD